MSASSKRVAWLALWLLLAIAAGLGLVFFFGDQPPAPVQIPATAPATQLIAATGQATSTTSPTIQSYGQLLHAALRDYPQTQPWGIPVDLTDAAHLILSDPIYVCSRGDIWITSPDADPLPTALARASTESEHLIDRPVRYIIWSPDRKGVWQPSAICKSADGLEVISANQTRPMPFNRAYRWDMAMTWDDNGVTRLIVPTDRGVSMITLGDAITEDNCPLTNAPPTTRPTPAPAVLFDTRGVLAWIPADANFSATRVARYLDGKWSLLGASDWPGDVVYLVPLLDGSVLQVRLPSDNSPLTYVSLDSPGIDETQIGSLVDQLGDDDPDKRIAAYQQLSQYGPRINSVLQKLASNAAPEAQVRIQQLIRGTTLGGMSVNGNQLTAAARLHDGGMVLLAPQGVTIPQEGQDPKVVSPDYLAVRPGRIAQELPPTVVDRLSKLNGSITAWGDEWIITTSDAGPARYLPPDQLDALLRPRERSFDHLYAIDNRGRWLFREDSSNRTLILDPTVPDPTPSLAIWLVDTGNSAGWNKAGWPAIKRGASQWLIDDQDFQPMDQIEDFQTDFPPVLYSAYSSTQPTAPPTTSPDASAGFGAPLMMDEHGNRYYDGKFTLTWVNRAGQQKSWPLPDSCASVEDAPAYLAEDHEGHFFLFNSTGRIARLRRGTADEPPFVLEAVFAEHVPDFHDIDRIWCDPAGRIDIAYEGSHLAIVFPTGQIAREIEDKILPQDLLRVDAP